MRLKKQCCRNCKYYGLGYSQTTQTEPVYVCFHHEKRIYRGDYNGVRGRKYYYSARSNFGCVFFEESTKDDETDNW